MVSRFFERLEHLLDPSRPTGANMSGTLLHHARLLAWERRHAQADLEHVLDWLLRIADARTALTAAGVSVDDTTAALEQLMDDLPAAAEDESPPFAARLDDIVANARVEGVCRTGKLVEGVAAALPRELTFLRAPLASVARDLGDLFDARIAFSEKGLTFEAWDPELKIAAELQQHLVDTRFKSNWWMTPATYFVGILLHKPYREAFAKRGVDAKALIDDMVASLPPPPKWTRERPDAVKPSIAPHLYALFLRAERYAAEDASDVRLRHALAAIHDERGLALWVERLAA